MNNKRTSKKQIKNILDFILDINTLKGKKRRGWLIHKIKDPETTAEHIFSLVLAVWAIGKNKKIDLNRAIKMALIHDICEVFAPDLTSYDAAAIDEKKNFVPEDVLKLKPRPTRPTIEQRKKLEKIKKKLEDKAIKKLISGLPRELKNEIKELWEEYEKQLTKEARFVKQFDKVINYIQGIQYWEKYGKIKHDLWMIRIREVIDDPDLIQLVEEFEKEIFSKKKKKKK